MPTFINVHLLRPMHLSFKNIIMFKRPSLIFPITVLLSPNTYGVERITIIFSPVSQIRIFRFLVFCHVKRLAKGDGCQETNGVVRRGRLEINFIHSLQYEFHKSVITQRHMYIQHTHMYTHTYQAAISCFGLKLE